MLASFLFSFPTFLFSLHVVVLACTCTRVQTCYTLDNLLRTELHDSTCISLDFTGHTSVRLAVRQ